MQTKIAIGTLLFMLIFVATGLVLLNEGVLPDQEINGMGRMQIEARAQLGRSIEAGGLIFISSCATCHGPNGEGIPGKGPVLVPDLFTKHFPAVKATGYQGTIRDFVKLTVAAGRPIQSTYAESLGGFAAPMPAWSQQYGGPMRDDQINNIAEFVLNWQAQAEAGPIVPSNFKAIGSDQTAELPTGDAAHGADLFTQKAAAASGSKLPCAACHSLTSGEIKVGPSLAGVATRAPNREPGKTAEQYLRESIQATNVYIVPDDPKYAANGKSVMPEGLGNNMSAQDLADMIAYLLTLK